VYGFVWVVGRCPVRRRLEEQNVHKEEAKTLCYPRKLSTLNIEDSKADKSGRPIASAVCLTIHVRAIPRTSGLFTNLFLCADEASKGAELIGCLEVPVLREGRKGGLFQALGKYFWI
jgi:hypothetical protein